MLKAQTLAAQGAASGTWVLAAQQTAGRGRRGRSWQSQPHSGVLLTIIVRPDPSAALAGVPLVFGLAAHTAVVRMLEAHNAGPTAGKAVGLKWPNDVLAYGKKLGGILVEADGVGTQAPVLRVGIGLNVAPACDLCLAPDVAARYIGLMQLVPKATVSVRGVAQPPKPHILKLWVEQLAWQLVGACFEAYTRWANAGLMPCVAAWPARDALWGRLVTAQLGGQHVTGFAQGIGADGRLRLVTHQGPVWVDSGEIQPVSAQDTEAHMPADSSVLTRSGAAVYVGLTPEAR